jgi:hypothetical protein
MLKRILLVWFVANFLVVGAAALLTGGWYLRWPALVRMVAELGLIILPNLLIPICSCLASGRIQEGRG